MSKKRLIPVSVVKKAHEYLEVWKDFVNVLTSSQYLLFIELEKKHEKFKEEVNKFSKK